MTLIAVIVELALEKYKPKLITTNHSTQLLDQISLTIKECALWHNHNL
jgi:hypothetical protein